MSSYPPLQCLVKELTIVSRAAPMRDVIGGAARLHPVFAVGDDVKVHPIWAADLIGHAFSEARTAADVARVRTSLRRLYQSARPVLDALADEDFWPGAPRIVRLEHRELLRFHPTTRMPTQYLQIFATVSLCSSRKHVRGPWDGPMCPAGFAWNADEPI
jgi:hypothetical protein